MDAKERERRIRRAAEKDGVDVDAIGDWRLTYQEGMSEKVDRSPRGKKYGSPATLYTWINVDNRGRGANHDIDVTSKLPVHWYGRSPAFNVKSCEPGKQLHIEKDKAASRGNRTRNMGAGVGAGTAIAIDANPIGPKRP